MHTPTLPFPLSSRAQWFPPILIRLHPTIQNLIDNAELQRLLGTHKVIALHQLLDLVETQLLLLLRLLVLLARVQMSFVDLIELAAHTEDLLGVDGDVGGLAHVAARGLVDHDAGVREAVALLGRAAAE
jgi:hypothetical protein